MVRRLVFAMGACMAGFAAMTAMGQTVTRPFSALRPPSGPAAAAHALIVELSPREALSGVHLYIQPTTPPPVSAQYVVWVNGMQVATADASDAGQTLAIAPQSFLPGVNSIQLARVPRSTTVSRETALANAAPVDDGRSSVALDFAGLCANTAPTLAQLPVAFDRRAWMPRTVAVELGDKPPSPGQLRAAGLAVQGIAARMRQVDVRAVYHDRNTAFARNDNPTSWEIAQNAAHDGDVLIVGVRNALVDMLPAFVERAVSGPFLGIYPANDGKSVIIVISGVTDADCARAAQAFADSTLVFSARNAITLDDATAVHAPPTHLAVSIAQDPSLVSAALNFAAVHARETGAPADFTFAFSREIANFDFLFGQDSALNATLRREVPPFPPLQTGQAVSVVVRSDMRRRVALLGSDGASVERAVEMLREPATWALFNRGPVLFNTAEGAAVPFAVTKRSPAAALRVLLADPLVFWSTLLALLVLSSICAHIALKAQVARRLADGARSSPSETTLKQKT